MWHKGHFEKRCQKRTVPTTAHLCTDGALTSLAGHSFGPHWLDTNLLSGEKGTTRGRTQVPQPSPGPVSLGVSLRDHHHQSHGADLLKTQSPGFRPSLTTSESSGMPPMRAEVHVCLTSQLFLNKGSRTAWRATAGTHRARTAQSLSWQGPGGLRVRPRTPQKRWRARDPPVACRLRARPPHSFCMKTVSVSVSPPVGAGSVASRENWGDTAGGGSACGCEDPRVTPAEGPERTVPL